MNADLLPLSLKGEHSRDFKAMRNLRFFFSKPVIILNCIIVAE